MFFVASLALLGGKSDLTPLVAAKACAFARFSVTLIPNPGNFVSIWQLKVKQMHVIRKACRPEILPALVVSPRERHARITG